MSLKMADRFHQAIFMVTSIDFGCRIDYCARCGGGTNLQ